MLKYKIALVLNRTNEKPKLQLYLDWFKKNTPIEIEFIDTIHTDFDVTPMALGNATFKGVVCNPNIVDKLKTVIPENKYNAVVLYVGNDLNGIRVSTVNAGGVSLYPDTELIQLRTINDNGKDLNHELFHAFFFKANKCQAGVTDNIDTYYNDSDLVVDGDLDTNREIALQTLKPYWDKICAFRNLSINTPTMNTYKYFSAKEIVGLKPELVAMLDKARGISQIAYQITSGFRTVAQNKLVGGVPNSAHLKGLAVDIAVTTLTRQNIMRGLLTCGTPVFTEDCVAHIHVDMDSSIHALGGGIISNND
jgi:hypothetical protein